MRACPFSILATVAVGATSSHAACTDENAVWSATNDSIEVRLEITKLDWSPEIRLGGWKSGHMLWTLDGRINCSNGVYVCYVDLPLTNGDRIEAPVELIEQNGDLTEYFVFAHLAQEAHLAQRLEGVVLQATRADGTANSEPIELPSIYEFLHCE